MTFDAMVESAQLPQVPGQAPLDKAHLKSEVTKMVLMLAEQVGDVRLDCVTAALSSDLGDKTGFTILIANAQYDALAARAALRKLQIQSKNVGGVEVFSPDEHIALLLPSNDRVILLAGPSGDQLPIETTLAALKTGKGELSTVQDMTRLIESIDTRQPLWAVMKVTDSYRRASVLAPFDSITLVGQSNAGALDLHIEALGDNANAVKDAVGDVQRGVQQTLGQIKPMLGLMPFLAPLGAALETVKCSSEGLKATLTASLKADTTLLMGPLLLFGAGPQPPAAIK